MRGIAPSRRFNVVAEANQIGAVSVGIAAPMPLVDSRMNRLISCCLLRRRFGSFALPSSTNSSAPM